MSTKHALVTYLRAWSGGAGCSTLAAALAVAAARQGSSPVLLIDAAPHHDLHAVLGMPEPCENVVQPVLDGLTLVRADSADDVLAAIMAHREAHPDAELLRVVVDAGTSHARYGDPASTVYCLRGPGYLELRRAATADRDGIAGVVVLAEPGRALAVGDVEACLGVKVLVSVDLDAAVARATDAGLLCGRLPVAIGRTAAALDGLLSMGGES